jgi:hypothetical protein
MTMGLFSERKGLKKIRTEIQVDSMDEALRNRLWNVLALFYWESMEHAKKEKAVSLPIMACNQEIGIKVIVFF